MLLYVGMVFAEDVTALASVNVLATHPQMRAFLQLFEAKDACMDSDDKQQENFLRWIIGDTVRHQAESGFRKIWKSLTLEEQDTIRNHFKRRIDRQEGIAREILQVCEDGED